MHQWSQYFIVASSHSKKLSRTVEFKWANIVLATSEQGRPTTSARTRLRRSQSLGIGFAERIARSSNRLSFSTQWNTLKQWSKLLVHPENQSTEKANCWSQINLSAICPNHSLKTVT
mmetsp:Transcript_44489/g.107184  ORF Transcript_44489/g.107184 Transcript_44489/m.107184 type:complete len:117 (+) Transcript_44489:1137-1487(+)